MSFSKKTVEDIKVAGKTVLLRADYNVPLDKTGKIYDTYRVDQSFPTIQYLLDQKAKVIICSHLGRPDGKRDVSQSLQPVANYLSEHFKHKVSFAHEAVGAAAQQAAQELEPGQILLLENLRFYPGEEANDANFAKQLAAMADVFVQDGFGVVHRAHASTDAITRYLPSVAGLLLSREVQSISSAMDNPERPLMAIIGGAKIADKIAIITRFVEIADFVVVGGAMANTFLQAEGIDIGRSISDPSDIPLAKKIIAQAKAEAKKRHFIFYIPQDGVVATSLERTAHTRIVDWDAHVIASVESYPKQPARKTGQVAEDELILDAGPFSGAFIAGAMQMMKTVVWNGALGVTETPSLQGPIGPFAHATELLIESLLGEFGHRPYSLLGGGDTVGYIEKRGLTKSFNHVSTGGGASLDLMSGKKLPGVEALQNK